MQTRNLIKIPILTFVFAISIGVIDLYATDSGQTQSQVNVLQTTKSTPTSIPNCCMNVNKENCQMMEEGEHQKMDKSQCGQMMSKQNGNMNMQCKEKMNETNASDTSKKNDSAVSPHMTEMMDSMNMPMLFPIKLLYNGIKEIF